MSAYPLFLPFFLIILLPKTKKFSKHFSNNHFILYFNTKRNPNVSDFDTCFVFELFFSNDIQDIIIEIIITIIIIFLLHLRRDETKRRFFVEILEFC